MKRVLNLVAIASLLATSVAVAPASAQEAAPPPAAAAPSGGGVSYKQKTVYDFDDDVVEGDLVRPDGEFAEVRTKAKHSSLIKIREHFIPEMLKSAEDVY
jgi:hypothetical protein